MLSGVLLESFKAHARLELSGLPKVVVLVGQNNTGKSAVLHAAALPKHGFTESPHVPIGDARSVVHNGAQQSRVTLDHVQAPSGSRFIKTYRVGRDGGVNEEQERHGPSPPNPQRVFYLSALRFVPGNFKYAPFTRDVGPTGGASGNILYQLMANGEPEFQSVVDWLTRMSMGIKFVGTPTQEPGMGSIVPDSYGAKVNIQFQGSGTGAVMPIVVQGVLCADGDILLVEEPETHLHRAAVDVLWEFFGDCARRGVQVLMTTHSLDLLASMSQRLEEGTLPADSVLYHFRRTENGGTAVEKRDPKVFRNIRETIKKDLAGLS